MSKIRAFLSHRLTFSSSNECGICYRRITEFMDVNPPPVIRVTRVRPSSEKVQFGKNAFSGFVFGLYLVNFLLSLTIVMLLLLNLARTYCSF